MLIIGNSLSIYEMHFNYRDTNRLKVKMKEKLYHANTNHKKAGMAILITDNVDFRKWNFARDIP